VTTLGLARRWRETGLFASIHLGGPDTWERVAATSSRPSPMHRMRRGSRSSYRARAPRGPDRSSGATGPSPAIGGRSP
jgi:hypothetical protein